MTRRKPHLAAPSGFFGWLGIPGSIALVACALLLLSPPVLAQLSSEGPGSKIEPRLKAQLAARASQGLVRFSVVIESGSGTSQVDPDARRQWVRARQQAIIDVAPKVGFGVVRRYENLSGFSAEGSLAAVEALAQHPWVSFVYAERRAFASLAQGVPLVGADQAHTSGFTGLGVGVVVIDSGIDTDHPDLVDDIVDERCWCSAGPGPINGCCPNGLETMSGRGAAEDLQGHGTTVSGIDP